ncbi:MAG: hypothetical protein HQM08_16870 [Candidatus Riflebacteria bacterium]|nr:hypothetical protein [Candidatus Riflebacteria bacterium]
MLLNIKRRQGIFFLLMFSIIFSFFANIPLKAQQSSIFSSLGPIISGIAGYALGSACGFGGLGKVLTGIAGYFLGNTFMNWGMGSTLLGAIAGGLIGGSGNRVAGIVGGGFIGNLLGKFFNSGSSQTPTYNNGVNTGYNTNTTTYPTNQTNPSSIWQAPTGWAPNSNTTAGAPGYNPVAPTNPTAQNFYNQYLASNNTFMQASQAGNQLLAKQSAVEANKHLIDFYSAQGNIAAAQQSQVNYQKCLADLNAYQQSVSQQNPYSTGSNPFNGNTTVTIPKY